MGAKHITASKLMKLIPYAECCDCAKEVAEVTKEQVWTIMNGCLIYCPACADYENLGVFS